MSWQPFIASIIVCVAALWLVRRVYRLFSGASQGRPQSCGTCAKNVDSLNASPLVQLDQKPRVESNDGDHPGTIRQ